MSPRTSFLLDCLLDRKLLTRERVLNTWKQRFEARDRESYLKGHRSPRAEALWGLENQKWKDSFWLTVEIQRKQFAPVREKFARYYADRAMPGVGRDDSPSPYNILFLGNDSPPRDEAIGNVDFMSIWNGGIRESFWSHWDGSIRHRLDRDLLVVLGASSSRESLPLQRGYIRKRYPNLVSLEGWLKNRDAPSYPLGVRADPDHLGEGVYNRECASCHGTLSERQGLSAAAVSPRLGSVIPLGEVATDPFRLNSITQAFIDLANRELPTLGTETKPGGIAARRSNGYQASFLDGVYLRAPYLHNGSVPTLADLLAPENQRPVTFYRGSDILDARRLGFLSVDQELEAAGEDLARLELFDTRADGNSNQGHPFGTALSDAEKWALIEYLKAF